MTKFEISWVSQWNNLQNDIKKHKNLALKSYEIHFSDISIARPWGHQRYAFHGWWIDASQKQIPEAGLIDRCGLPLEHTSQTSPIWPPTVRIKQIHKTKQIAWCWLMLVAWGWGLLTKTNWLMLLGIGVGVPFRGPQLPRLRRINPRTGDIHQL